MSQYIFKRQWLMNSTSFWMRFECVLDSSTATLVSLQPRTAASPLPQQMAVLAEMKATGSSGEINYGKGLFYLRPCRLWSPYNPGQLPEMNATGSSGEINYGKGLFYLRPCRLWSPYNPGQLPHCCLTVTSLWPHRYLTSSYYSYAFMVSNYSPSQEFQVSHSVRFQLTYKYALININAISAPSDTRKRH